MLPGHVKDQAGGEEKNGFPQSVLLSRQNLITRPRSADKPHQTMASSIV